MKKAVGTIILVLAVLLSDTACMNTSDSEMTLQTKKVVVHAERKQEKRSELKHYIYYEVPREYAIDGGEFSDELQEFTQDLCEERKISYPLVLAMIERETGYRNVDPNGFGSTGYMQVIQKWHEDRMAKFGVADLLEPKGNITVGIDYLAELSAKYGEVNMVLMAYNMGESRAKELWEDGIYTSDYADYIVKREAEISLEIYGR